MSWRRLHSLASVPTAPRKYLVVTIVAALTDQKSGNSTPRCSKTVSPVLQFCWTTSRRSQVSSSYGCRPGVVKIRSIVNPRAAFGLPRRFSPACWLWPLTVSVIPRSLSVSPARALPRVGRRGSLRVSSSLDRSTADPRLRLRDGLAPLHPQHRDLCFEIGQRVETPIHRLANRRYATSSSSRNGPRIASPTSLLGTSAAPAARMRSSTC